MLLIDLIAGLVLEEGEQRFQRAKPDRFVTLHGLGRSPPPALTTVLPEPDQVGLIR
jgi:hypothetical protein